MSERLRILHVLRAPVGGLFRHVCDLAIEQAARGADVGVIAGQSDGLESSLWRGRLHKMAGHLSLGLHETAMAREIGPSDFAASGRIAKIAHALKVDILHGHGAKGGAYARLAGGLLRLSRERVGVLYTPHGGSLHYDPRSLKGWAFFSLEWGLQRLTDGLIFESAFAARVYAERVGGGKVERRVIPNGVAAAEFAPVAVGPEASDALFVGELRALKGVDVLLQALALASGRVARPLTLAVVGEGPDRAAFEEITQVQGLGDQVTFHGVMPARAAFTLGRVLVVPSRAESLPYIALEAAAAGLPVLATNVGGIPEIFAGTGQRLLAPGDAHALSDALVEAVLHPGPAAQAAAILQARVAKAFSVEAMTDAVGDFYTHVNSSLTTKGGALPHAIKVN